MNLIFKRFRENRKTILKGQQKFSKFQNIESLNFEASFVGKILIFFNQKLS
jgi:hypothetical protein